MRDDQITLVNPLYSKVGLFSFACDNLFRYTRGSFNLPGAQSSPHRSFSEEVSVLDEYFSDLAIRSKAFVMGSGPKNWHVYSASARGVKPYDPIYTVEMCKNGLAKKCASVFYKIETSSAASMTERFGIRKILPNSLICDFEFDLCGYSMNAVERCAISMVHVTPEEGFNYSSFESVGYDPNVVDLSQMAERVLDRFKPEEFSIAVHAGVLPVLMEKMCCVMLRAYRCTEFCLEEVEIGSSVIYDKC